ncbi:MAG TPA: cytochrome C [Gammaproteobacteria bacterium]|jgi:nitric oxide reductase subunit C|nr:cytochrome c [Gammaproteobacteria bacterium]HAJ75784.1 cytochrome C [Gammaproteobacteria bacterium]|tara:strand:- start:974 stop:1573 length:600 start_codon:yes stop_codon:yes gene_type:complete
MNSVWWASEDFWRKMAVWLTAVMTVVLILLTFDTVKQITAGSERVPAYSAINHRIYYRFDSSRNMQVPVIGDSAPLFGTSLSEEDAEALVSKGKLTTQAKNCMNCHTLLGNGAYYAPDLTKAWLDPAWGSEAAREQLMVNFLLDPHTNARGYGTGRKMPNLGITEEEAHGVVAFLKWMSTIDTNGFPRNFTPISQEGDR